MPDCARFDAWPLLPLPGMDTNDRLRKRARRLVKAGVSQKALAAKMKMTEGTFSKWLNEKGGIGPPSVASLDGLNDFAKELTFAALDEDNQAAAAAPTAKPQKAG